MCVLFACMPFWLKGHTLLGLQILFVAQAIWLGDKWLALLQHPRIIALLRLELWRGLYDLYVPLFFFQPTIGFNNFRGF